ncbi:MAG: DUF3040 domain-containing protein [Propionibacteriaceae bacterium]|jgi:hypothetical protein|nr:DUF3040 domain-containing protein [Propionibacteriaceae bacterium]
MALTEAEQKLLAELEATLTAQDPKLASKLTQPHRRVHPSQAIGGVLGFLVGMAALVVGIGMGAFWWISIVGFVVMLASVILVMSAWNGLPGQGKTSPAAVPQAPKAPVESMMDKLERRWRDRQEQ